MITVNRRINSDLSNYRKQDAPHANHADRQPHRVSTVIIKHFCLDSIQIRTSDTIRRENFQSWANSLSSGVASPPAPAARPVVRRPIVGGNWKCVRPAPQRLIVALSLLSVVTLAALRLTRPRRSPAAQNLDQAGVRKLVAALNELDASGCDVVVAPVALHIPLATAALKSDVAVAAQNCNFKARTSPHPPPPPTHTHGFAQPPLGNRPRGKTRPRGSCARRGRTGGNEAAAANAAARAGPVTRGLTADRAIRATSPSFVRFSRVTAERAPAGPGGVHGGGGGGAAGGRRGPVIVY